jgi:hypothetical protein
MNQLKCPARESSEFLCDREAEYQVNGTIYCEKHARRIIEGGMMREATEPALTGAVSDGW